MISHLELIQESKLESKRLVIVRKTHGCIQHSRTKYFRPESKTVPGMPQLGAFPIGPYPSAIEKSENANVSKCNVPGKIEELYSKV